MEQKYCCVTDCGGLRGIYRLQRSQPLKLLPVLAYLGGRELGLVFETVISRTGCWFANHGLFELEVCKPPRFVNSALQMHRFFVNCLFLPPSFCSIRVPPQRPQLPTFAQQAVSTQLPHSSSLVPQPNYPKLCHARFCRFLRQSSPANRYANMSPVLGVVGVRVLYRGPNCRMRLL